MAECGGVLLFIGFYCLISGTRSRLRCSRSVIGCRAGSASSVSALCSVLCALLLAQCVTGRNRPMFVARPGRAGSKPNQLVNKASESSLALVLPESLKSLSHRERGWDEGRAAQLTNCCRRTLIRHYVPLSPDGRREKSHTCCYLPRSSTSNGSIRTSNQFIPQCRCGPVARPVAPTAAITWPCSTRSPTLTSIRDRCRKLELIPKP